MLSKDCPCGATELFSDCCYPYISAALYPPTAEALMRSRYTAYATSEVSYIIATTHPSTRYLYDPIEILAWAQSSQWQKLEIIKTLAGTSIDTSGKVEFKAYYLNQNSILTIHHEYSTFKKLDGKWYFVDGKVY